jgi:hypothetical protein
LLGSNFDEITEELVEKTLINHRFCLSYLRLRKVFERFSSQSSEDKSNLDGNNNNSAILHDDNNGDSVNGVGAVPNWFKNFVSFIIKFKNSIVCNVYCSY